MSLMLFAACTVAAISIQLYKPPVIEVEYKNVMRQVLVYAHHIVKQVDTTPEN